MPGPPPKPPGQSRNRPAKALIPPRRKLDKPPESHPPLPGQYLPRTAEWYQTWATSPQASRFLATDWQRLHMLAPIVDAYFAEPKVTLLAEIRINEASLGATEADRLRLRWDVDTPTAAPAASPKAAAARRESRRAGVMRLVSADGGAAG